MKTSDSEQSSDEESDIQLPTKEYDELVLSAYQIIYDTISENPLLYTKPNFHNTTVDITFEMLSAQLASIKELIMQNTDETRFEELIYNIIHESFDTFYLNNAPPRESGNTYTSGTINVSKITEQIEFLKSVPQPDQRTDEWYHFRHKYLTASSLWKVFSTAGARNSIIYGKCAPLNTSKYKGFSLDSPMHWGNKYEPVSILWYEHTYNTVVSDF